MKTLPILAVALLLLACSGTKHLAMSPETDLSSLPSEAQCWLVEFEDVCSSISGNEDFSNTESLQSDIKRIAALLKDLSDEENAQSWYGALTETQSERLHELMLAVVVHYGVKHFVDV